MIVLYERSTSTGETVEQFAARINADTDRYRIAGLNVGLNALPSGEFFAMIGFAVRAPHPQLPGNFVVIEIRDLIVADVEKALREYEEKQAKVAEDRRKLDERRRAGGGVILSGPVHAEPPRAPWQGPTT